MKNKQALLYIVCVASLFWASAKLEAQCNDITLTLTGYNPTCPDNGSIKVAISGPDAGNIRQSDMQFQVSGTVNWTWATYPNDSIPNLFAGTYTIALRAFCFAVNDYVVFNTSATTTLTSSYVELDVVAGVPRRTLTCKPTGMIPITIMSNTGSAPYTITMTGSPLSYTGTKTFVTSTTGAPYQIPALPAGNYTFTVADACTYTKTVNATVDPLPQDFDPRMIGDYMYALPAPLLYQCDMVSIQKQNVGGYTAEEFHYLYSNASDYYEVAFLVNNVGTPVYLDTLYNQNIDYRLPSPYTIKWMRDNNATISVYARIKDTPCFQLLKNIRIGAANFSFSYSNIGCVDLTLTHSPTYSFSGSLFCYPYYWRVMRSDNSEFLPWQGPISTYAAQVVNNVPFGARVEYRDSSGPQPHTWTQYVLNNRPAIMGYTNNPVMHSHGITDSYYSSEIFYYLQSNSYFPVGTRFEFVSGPTTPNSTDFTLSISQAQVHPFSVNNTQNTEYVHLLPGIYRYKITFPGCPPDTIAHAHDVYKILTDFSYTTKETCGGLYVFPSGQLGIESSTGTVSPITTYYQLFAAIPSSIPIDNRIILAGDSLHLPTTGAYRLGMNYTNVQMTISYEDTVYYTQTPFTLDPSKTSAYVCEDAGVGFIRVAGMGGSGHYAYELYDAGTFIASNTTGVFNYGVAGATYTIRLIDTDPACAASYDQTVYMLDLGIAQLAYTNDPTNKFCLTDSIYLRCLTLGETTYTWAGPGITSANEHLQNPAIFAGDIGPGIHTYTITVTPEGCGHQMVQTLMVTVTDCDVWEIWNWEDLSLVPQKISQGVTDFVVMQHIGVPGGGNYGNGSTMGAGAQGLHPGDKRFGWYGYEGYIGNNQTMPYATYTPLAAAADAQAAIDFNSWTPATNLSVGWHATEGWVPLNINTAISVDFDGQGYRVSGLWTNRPNAVSQGLFGHLSLCDIYIRNLSVHISNKLVIGRALTGGLVGYMDAASTSIIEDIVVTGAGVLSTGYELTVGDNINYMQYGRATGGVIGRFDGGTLKGAIYAGNEAGPVGTVATTNPVAGNALIRSNSYVGGVIGSVWGGVIDANLTNYMTVKSLVSGPDGCFGGIIGQFRSGQYEEGTFGSPVRTSTIVPQHTWRNYGRVDGNNDVGGIIGRYSAFEYPASVPASDRTQIDKTAALFSNNLTSTTTQIINNDSVTVVYHATDASDLGNRVGGFFGYFNGLASGFTNLTNTQTVIGNTYVGGISGYLEGANMYGAITNGVSGSTTNMIKLELGGGCLGGLFGYCINNAMMIEANLINYMPIVSTSTAAWGIGGISGAFEDGFSTSGGYTFANYGTITHTGFDVGGLFGRLYLKRQSDFRYSVNSAWNTLYSQSCSPITFSNVAAPGVIQVISNGQITGNTSWVGGYVGSLYINTTATFDNITNTLPLTATSSAIGGFAAGIFPQETQTGEVVTFNNIKNTAPVTGQIDIGGLAGQIRTTGLHSTYFTNIENEAPITGTSRVGGLCGTFDAGYYLIPPSSYPAPENIFFTNCTNKAAITGTSDFVGGFFGYIDTVTYFYSYYEPLKTSTTLSYLTNTGSVKGNDYVGGISGTLSKTIALKDSITNGAPATTATVEGRNYVGGIVGYNKGRPDLNNTAIYTPAVFTATNRMEVKATGSKAGGFAGEVNHAGLYLNGTKITNDLPVTGNTYVGGIFGSFIDTATVIFSGFANSSVVGLSNTGNILYVGTGGGQSGGVFGSLDDPKATLENYANKVSVRGATNVGGIVGLLSAPTAGSMIQICYNTGAIEATTAYAGGIAGAVGRSTDSGAGSGAIENVFNLGPVTGSSSGGLVGNLYNGSLAVSYNAGRITGTNARGAIGVYTTASVSNVRFDTTTSGIAAANGGHPSVTGLPTSSMIERTGIWTTYPWHEGLPNKATYPFFTWQIGAPGSYYLDFAAIYPGMDRTVGALNATIDLTGVLEPAPYSFNTYATTAAGYYQPLTTSPAVNTLPLSSTYVTAGTTPVSVGAMSESNIVAFDGTWEIWNWSDLSKVMEKQAFGYTNFVLMQDIGIPGQPSTYGNAFNNPACPWVGTTAAYGWYGYEGVTVESAFGSHTLPPIGTPAHGWDAEGWTPIGTYVDYFPYSHIPFIRHFNGNDKTITGLWINRVQSGVGLFGVVGGNAYIHDLTIAIGRDVGSSPRPGITNALNYVGGAVGALYSGNPALNPVLENISVKASGANSVISSTGTDGNIGGIVGSVNNGFLTGTFINEVTINAAVGSGVGGIAGVLDYRPSQGFYATITPGAILENHGAINGTWNTGGIIGLMGSLIDRGTIFSGSDNLNDNILVKNTGIVNGTRSVGSVFGFFCQATIKDYVNTVAVTGSLFAVGGICGDICGAFINDCTNTGAITCTGTGEYGGAGGIVGITYQNTSTTLSGVSGCYNLGALTGPNSGGIVACLQNATTLTNSYNLGSITGANSGGVIGLLQYYGESNTIINVYNAGRIVTPGSKGVIGSNTAAGNVMLGNLYFDTTTSGVTDGGHTSAIGLTTTAMTGLADIPWRTAPWGPAITGKTTYPYLLRQLTGGVEDDLGFASIVPQADKTVSSLNATIDMTGVTDPAKYSFNTYATTPAGYYQPLTTSPAVNTLPLSSSFVTAGTTPVSIGVMSESNIVAFSGTWEIWNWDDLSQVMAKQAAGYTNFVVMQDIGIPGQPGTYGDAFSNSACPWAGTNAAYGWYGYEGFGVGVSGFNMYTALTGTALTTAYTTYKAGTLQDAFGWKMTTLEGWIPIGITTGSGGSGNQGGIPFWGEFDGNDKTVTGLWIDRPTAHCQGLFGIVWNTNIHNLTVSLASQGISGNNEVGGIIGCINMGYLSVNNMVSTLKDLTVDVMTNAMISGHVWVGGIYGVCVGAVNVRLLGTLENNADINAFDMDSWGGCGGGISGGTGIVANSNAVLINHGEITGSQEIGGLFGEFWGGAEGEDLTISSLPGSGSNHLQFINTGNVSGTRRSIGGFVGYFYPWTDASDIYVTHLVNTVNVTGGEAVTNISMNGVGGIFGHLEPEEGVHFEYLENRGVVTGINEAEAVGGVIGMLQMRSNDPDIFQFFRNSGTVSGPHLAGGIIGCVYYRYSIAPLIVQSSYNTGMITSANIAGGIIGGVKTDDLSSAGLETTIEDCYNLGALSGNIVGGIAGTAGRAGEVAKTLTLSNVYNAGRLTGTGSTPLVNGILGNVIAPSTATATNAYYDMVTSGASTSGPVTATGLITAAMTELTGLWRLAPWSPDIPGFATYPYLEWQIAGDARDNLGFFTINPATDNTVSALNATIDLTGVPDPALYGFNTFATTAAGYYQPLTTSPSLNTLPLSPSLVTLGVTPVSVGVKSESDIVAFSKLDISTLMTKNARVMLTPIPFAHNGTSANPVSVLYGDHIEYSLTAVNVSAIPGTVIITDTLPAYLDYYSSSPPITPTMTTGTPPRYRLQWTLNNVPSMADTTVTVEATPQSGVLAWSQALFPNRAWVGINTMAFPTNYTYHQGAGVSMVTFSAGYGGSIYQAIEQVLDFGTSPRSGVVIAPDEGYRFAGWSHADYVSLRGELIPARRGIMQYDTLIIYGNVNLHADFEPEVYPITYYLHGGHFPNDPLSSPLPSSSYTIESGVITLVAPEKADDVFTGWTGSNGDEPQLTVTIPHGSTGEKVYFANYLLSGREEIDVQISSDDRIWAVKNELFVRTTHAGSILRIYSLDGVLQRLYTILQPGETKYKLPGGLYVVTLNNGLGRKVFVSD